MSPPFFSLSLSLSLLPLHPYILRFSGLQATVACKSFWYICLHDERGLGTARVTPVSPRRRRVARLTGKRSMFLALRMCESDEHEGKSRRCPGA